MRRLLKSLSILFAFGLFAVGCGSSGAPTSYADQEEVVRTYYVEGCVVGLEEAGEEDLVAAAASVCKCAFDEIERTIAFEAFEELNNELKEDLSILRQSPLPQGSTEAQINTIVGDCIRSVDRPSDSQTS